MDIMEPVPYVEISSGYALLRLVLSNWNNPNSYTEYTSELRTQQNQVIKHANFLLRRRWNLKERHLQRCQGRNIVGVRIINIHTLGLRECSCFLIYIHDSFFVFIVRSCST